MRALLDTNIVLDFLLDRPPFAEAAAAIWDALAQKRFEGYVSAITPVNLFYIARKLKGAEMARASVEGVNQRMSNLPPRSGDAPDRAGVAPQRL